MKRTIGMILIMVMLAINGPLFSAFAQDALPNPMMTAEPQFALPLLNEYFKGQEASNRKSGIVMAAIGTGLFALGIGSGVYAFTAPATDFSSAEEQMALRGATVAVGGTGLILGSIGMLTLAQPSDKYLIKYAYLYAETDPVVQEALAYGIMKDIADDAKRSRITGGIIGISVPVATIGAQALIAAFSNDWENFNGNVLSSLSWTLPNLVSGLVMLVGGTSKEERLLETYRSTSNAYRGSK